MARFVSRYNNYQILLKATYVEVKNGIPILHRGDKVTFERGEFATEDKKLIETLRKHPAFGKDFVEVKELEEKQKEEDPKK